MLAILLSLSVATAGWLKFGFSGELHAQVVDTASAKSEHSENAEPGTLILNGASSDRGKGIDKIVANGTGNTVNSNEIVIGIGATLTLDTPLAGDTLVISTAISNDSSNMDDDEPEAVLSGISKRGLGTVTLSGANTYNGTTTVRAGTLIISGSAPNTTTGVTNVEGGELHLDKPMSVNAINNVLTVGKVTDNRTSATVRLFNDEQIRDDVDLALNNNSRLHLNGHRETVGTLNDNATGGAIIDGDSSQSVFAVGNGDFSGVIQNTAGSLSLTKTLGRGGLLTLRGMNTYRGETTIRGGILALNHPQTNNSIPNSSIIRVASGAFFNVTRLSRQMFILANGQTLTGAGTVTGDITVADGAEISPGDKLGILTTTGMQEWSSGGRYTFHINDADAYAGSNPGSNLIEIHGTLAVTATSAERFRIMLTSLTLDNTAGVVHDFDKFSNYAWLFVEAQYTITSFEPEKFVVNTSGFVNDISGQTDGSFHVVRGDAIGGNDRQLYILYTPAVPMPASKTLGWVIIGLAIILLIWGGRRLLRRGR